MFKQFTILLVLLLSLTMVSCSDDRTLIIPLSSNYDLTNNVKLSTSTVSNTVIETEVFSSLIPANTITIGKIAQVFSFGTVSTASASDSVIIRFKINGITLHTFIMTPKVVTNADFHLEGTATQRTGGLLGERVSHQKICIDNVCEYKHNEGIYNTAELTNLTITAQWNNAKVGNSFSIYQGFMEFKNGAEI